MLRSKLSSAGFAAAIPILATRGLGEMLSSGRAAPSGLHAKVLAKMTAPRVSLRSQRSVRRAPVKSHSSLAMAGVAAVVVAAGVAVWAISAKETPPGANLAASAPPAPAPVTLAALAAAPVPAHIIQAQAPAVSPEVDLRNKKMARLADWHRRWTFDNGVPKDLFIAFGDWKWNSATSTMDVANEVRIFPIYTLPDNPMLFTMKGNAIDAQKEVRMGLELFRGKALISDTGMWSKHHDLTSRDVTQKLYVYRNRVVGLMNGEIGMVSEHSEDSADAAAIFQIVNYSIRELTATPLTEDEVPDFVKNPEKIVKDMRKVELKPADEQKK
jgi:hypothetical protein